MADLRSMNETEGIGIAGIKNQPNGLPADCSATQPDESAQTSRQLAEIEQIAGGQRIEVSCEHVKSVLLTRDACQQRTQLDDAMPFGPRRVQRAQVQAEDSQLARARIDLEKGMTRQPRMMPFKVTDRAAAHEGKRFSPGRRPLRHAGSCGELLDDGWDRRFLKD